MSGTDGEIVGLAKAARLAAELWANVTGVIAGQ
jgi:hypothetical protein